MEPIKVPKDGWARAAELAEVARRAGKAPIVQSGCTKPASYLRNEFKREVSKHLTGKEIEPWEILNFKAYKIQLPVIEQALEIVGLMLGSEQIPRLLPGDDLRRFSGGGDLRDRKSRCSPNFANSVGTRSSEAAEESAPRKPFR